MFWIGAKATHHTTTTITPTSLLCQFGLLVSLAFSPATWAQAGAKAPLLYKAQHEFVADDAATRHLPFVGGTGPVVPKGLLVLPETTRFVLWAELENGRLYVLENKGAAGFVPRQRIPISIGKNGIGKVAEGDNKTPIGIYQLQSHLVDAELDDFYGNGAYTLNYPNALDRLQHKSGHGIWLHGLPKVQAERSFLASEGCVVVDNATLTALADLIEVGSSLVVLSADALQWVPAEEQKLDTLNLQLAMKRWERAWESRNIEQYMAFYAGDFTDFKLNRAQWQDYKSTVFADKSFIELKISDVMMLREPTDPNVVKVLFQQDYVSDNLHWHGHKEMLWQWQGGQWQIIYEGEG